MTLANYKKSYSILGVFPDDDRETVRSAYKRQIRRWHPDRFQDPDQRKIAEDKCKDINLAYEMLDDYYRQHGALPPEDVSGRHEPLPAGDPSSQYEDHAGSDPEQNTDADQHRDTSGGSQQTAHRGYTRILIAVIAIASGYILSEPLLTDHPDITDADHSGLTDSWPTTANLPAKRADPAIYSATSGAGNNTQNAHTKWKDDWKEMAQDSGHPATPGRLPYITRGSTKQDVLAIQGSPIRQTDVAWDYGLSRINFQNGKVTDWYENPMNPLIVKR